MRTLCAIAAMGAVAAWSPNLMAEPPPPTRAPRVWHAPTAWLQPHARPMVSAGASHRGAPFAAVLAGLGGVAEIGVELGPNTTDCRRCDDADEGPSSITTAHALFRVGVAESTWWRGLPALVLGFRGPMGDVSVEHDGLSSIRSAHLYLTASKTLRGVRLHTGAGVWDVAARTGEQQVVLDRDQLAPRVRPFAGVSWTPDIYPRTSVMADVAWQPNFSDGRAALAWTAAWGIRYEALAWGSVELGVRHREGEDLADSTVLVRVNVRRR